MFFLRIKGGSVEEEFQELQRGMGNIPQQFSPILFHELFLAHESIFPIYSSFSPSHTQHLITILSPSPVFA